MATCEATAKRKLAASLRWFESLGMNESIANHFSYMIEERKMLVNRHGLYFGNATVDDITSADLTKSPEELMGYMREDHPNRPKIDRTALCIHGEIHKQLGKRARCIMHLHPQYLTALASTKFTAQQVETCSPLPAICQNTAMFHKYMVVDTVYNGFADVPEAQRMADVLNKYPRAQVMLMGNHGVLVIGETIDECTCLLYYAEMATRNYITALSTGRELNYLKIGMCVFYHTFKLQC